MNELNFTVHFTLHRTENTVGKEISYFLMNYSCFAFFFLAFFTSELVENQRVNYLKTHPQFSSVLLESRMVLFTISISSAISSRYEFLFRFDLFRKKKLQFRICPTRVDYCFQSSSSISSL